MLANRRNRRGRHREHRLGHSVAREEPRAREALPRDHAERPHVRAPIERVLRVELLRRRVGELALHLARHRAMQPLARARDAEVDHATRAVEADQQVRRRHVAVHHLERHAAVVAQLVRRVQPLARVRDQARSHERKTRAQLGVLQRLHRAAQLRERVPEHEGHREEVHPVHLAEVRHTTHVRVRDSRGDARLVEEHRDELRILREVRVDELERHELLVAPRPERARGVHGSHAARRELRAQLVAPEPPARAELDRHHGRRGGEAPIAHRPTG